MATDSINVIPVKIFVQCFILFLQPAFKHNQSSATLPSAPRDIWFAADAPSGTRNSDPDPGTSLLKMPFYPGAGYRKH
jgi:hypothetical protein